MNHPIEQEELMAYLDGELLPGRAAITAAHLEECRECRAVAADLQGVGRQLMAWQVESAGPRVGESVRLSVREAVRQPPVRPAQNIWPWTIGALAFTVLAFLVISTIHYQMTSSAARLGLLPQISALQAPPITRPMIVHKAQVTLTTWDFEKARLEMEDILKRHSGYIGQLTTNSPERYGRTMEATLRVPDDQRDAVLVELRKLGRVESESQTGEEVTPQFVDLEARLINARNTEQRLTGILRQRTGKLSDVLAVEQEIDKVRGEIERMEAERKTLANRVAYATINLKIDEAYTAKSDTIGARLRSAAVDGYRNVVESVVNVTFVPALERAGSAALARDSVLPRSVPLETASRLPLTEVYGSLTSNITGCSIIEVLEAVINR